MTSSSWIGKTLGGRYKIDELLGQGGMSAVYKATDPNLRRVVAIKMIHSHLSNDPGFLRRFEEEATAVAQLRHPNIVQVYDFNHDDGTYYMVLEFVPGETLQDHLRRLNTVDRRLSINEVTRYAAGVCDAVDYAHQRGLIHRDIKPANIMLSVMGQAILMDFGIAKIIGGQQHTATGAVVGTAMYMSPEQIKGEHPDRRTDIYSLGVTLFEMVSGHPPFEADSAMTLMMMHINDPVPDLKKLNPEVPPDLVAVINKALAKNPNDRYQTAAEMASALRMVQERLASSKLAGRSQAGATLLEEPEESAFEATDSGQDEFEQVAFDGTLVEPSPPPVRTVVEPYSRKTGTRVEQPPRSAPPIEKRPSGGSVLPKIGNFRPTILIAGVVALLALVCVIGGTALAYNQFFGGGGTGELTAPVVSTTAAAAGIVPAEDTPQPTETAAQPSPAVTLETDFPTETPAAPTNTLAPTETPTITLTPTATVPVGIPFARINSITIEGDRYIVNYETFEFTEQISSETLHVHFFFDTVPPEQAGVPGNGPWILYGGPRPFTGYRVTERPAAATQMCILVANPDHSVQANSGNCHVLPDVATPTPESSSPYGGSSVTDDFGVEMILIPGGPFLMGTDDNQFIDENPAHTVELADFYIDKYEVTNSQYAKCVDAGVCEPPVDTSSITRTSYYGHPEFDNFPVVYINYAMAEEYCEWREGRLPTEQEWEKAARGTDGRTYPWGEEINCDYTNYNGCSEDTAEVGSFSRDISPYGVYDMAGNVREYTADWYDVYPGGDPSAAPEFGQTHRVYRGGAFGTNENQTRVSNRAAARPEDTAARHGFRCARDP